MNIKNETIYVKAKQLRHLINDAVNSSAFEDVNFNELLLNLSLQIPLQIGLSLSIQSIECTRFHLEDAEKKLIELYIAIDLNTSEYFQIDSTKLDSLTKEIFELFPITLNKAEEEEEKRMEECMKEFILKEDCLHQMLKRI